MLDQKSENPTYSEPAMAKDYLTTTQAARLLAVSPDTVLKWVKAGKIGAYLTPGGHCRIPREVIDELMVKPSGASNVRVASPTTFHYCWELARQSSDHCDTPIDCVDCIVYRGRVERCYELAELPEIGNSIKHRCGTSCEKCDYYHMVHDKGTSILVVTRSASLRKRLKRGDDALPVEMRFAGSEYEVSALIESFRPDYVVIDTSIGVRQTRSLCSYLADDTRLPFPRLILAANAETGRLDCGQEVLGWLRKPFNSQHLLHFLSEARSARL